MDISKFFAGRKKTGLALGGGAVFGAAHVGVLKALKEKEVEINFISGTSIGAFIAAFVAFEMKLEDIESLVRELNWLDISNLSLSKYALLSNEKFGKVVIDALGDVNIEDAKIPLAIVSTNISNGDKVVLRKGNLAKAVMASTCIPGIFNPVELEGKWLVDGGVVENVPVNPLIEMGADRIIAVDLNTGSADNVPGNIIEVLLNSFRFVLKSASKEVSKKAHLLIDPDLSAYNRYDVDQSDELIEKGYSKAKELLINF